MGSILSSLSKTVIAGFILLGIIVAIFGNVNFLEPAWLAFAFRWLHVMVGVMWIGLLGTLILSRFHPCQNLG